jgi:hypothetical protein
MTVSTWIVIRLIRYVKSSRTDGMSSGESIGGRKKKTRRSGKKSAAKSVKSFDPTRFRNLIESCEKNTPPAGLKEENNPNTSEAAALFQSSLDWYVPQNIGNRPVKKAQHAEMRRLESFHQAGATELESAAIICSTRVVFLSRTASEIMRTRLSATWKEENGEISQIDDPGFFTVYMERCCPAAALLAERGRKMG